ncbi:MAG: chromosome segregation protein SMC [Saprospiraceae bacterium]
MRLTSLEIKGFKSFANETIINFNEDVIGIVGPNGSGKSNVVDAIRWVLGEQKSKELRLEKMSNLIFNGTKKRKQGGSASVALTFENTKNLLPTEYNTVKIARILYRTGESEYRLNNVPCRLKDINSLLMDTGIGSNSYAIIALGMVDDILTDKNDSRRRMFEQAAGISKYKKRKRETINKLKNTEADLDRVEDLLFEIDGNLKSLEKQAKRTKRFYELKEKYKDQSIELAVHRLKGYKGRHEEITTKLTTEEDRFRDLDVASSQLEAKLESDKKDNLDKEKLLSERQRDLNELVGKLRGMENDKRIFAQKVNFIQENEVKLSEQIRIAKIKVEQLHEEIEDYRIRLNDDKMEEAALEQVLEEVEENLAKIRSSHGNLKTELEEYVQTQQKLEREIFELEKQKAINANQFENLERDLAKGQEEIASKKGEIGTIEQEMSVLDSKRDAQSEKVTKLVAEEEQRQVDIVEAEHQVEDLRKKIADVNRTLDAKRNEYKLTKSMVENLEGFPESIRFLSKNKDWLKNASLLSDLIYCKEEYRIAIENYLEPYLNYYVVKNLEEAHDAIKLLGRSQKGKANFFILDAFKAYETPMSMLPDTQRAIDLVETDPPYRNLCSYLLENVLVTESEDLVDQVRDKDIVVLSKSGRFVQRRFSISGGSVGLFEGKKIGRKKNLEVLQLTIKKLEKEERELSSQYFKIKTTLEDLKANIKTDEIQREREVLNQFSQQKVSFMTRLENFENFLRDVNLKHEDSANIIASLKRANEQIEVDLKARKDIAAQAKAQISDTDDTFRKIADELSVASNAFNEKNIEFIRQQNKVNSIQRELSFRENQFEETKYNLGKNQQTLEQSQIELEEIETEIKRLEENLVLLYEQKKEKAGLLSSAEQNYFQVRGGISDIEDELRKVNRARSETQLLITSLKDKFNEMKLDLSSTGERLKIEFGVDLEEVMQREANLDIDPEELQTKVERLKSRLEKYGEINPMAVEAYDEMKIRYDSITEQKNDILAAKSSLLDTIKEIEDSATTQFMEAFTKARTYFIDVFRTLFTEDDSCDLILSEPENPLESPIKIIAQPKGKRPQSINQLSGGEKTLTATALLFALYLLKPAPFCIFDEVDAPLDDANIEKFNKIVRKFSKESQFIIVTHNKETMAAVDVIYGVYMQEQGVSGVSPVDFRELDHSSTLQTIAN